MSYQETAKRVQEALEKNQVLTVEMDAGTFEMSGDDLSQAWEDLAPGEAFEIIVASKLAGNVIPGDRIMWDGLPATVVYADKYRTAMLPGVQVELMVEGDDFTAADVVHAGDYIILA